MTGALLEMAPSSAVPASVPSLLHTWVAWGERRVKTSAAPAGHRSDGGPSGASHEVLDEPGASLRAITDPELLAVHAVIGQEEGLAARGRQVRQIRAGESGEDVLDKPGAGLRAITDPELPAVHAIIRHEEGLAAQRPQKVGARAGGAWRDVLEEVRPRRRCRHCSTARRRRRSPHSAGRGGPAW